MNDQVASTQPASTPDAQAAPAQTEVASAQPVPAQAQTPAVAAAAPVVPAQDQENKWTGPENVEDHKAGLILHLLDSVKTAKGRRELLRTTEAIIKEDRFIQHLEGVITILRQFRP